MEKNHEEMPKGAGADNKQPSNEVSAKDKLAKSTTTTKRCLVGAVVISVLVLSLALVAVIIVLASIFQFVGNLESKIQELEQKLNQTENAGIQRDKQQGVQLSSLQSSVDTLNTTT